MTFAGGSGRLNGTGRRSFARKSAIRASDPRLNSIMAATPVDAIENKSHLWNGKREMNHVLVWARKGYGGAVQSGGSLLVKVRASVCLSDLLLIRSSFAKILQVGMGMKRSITRIAAALCLAVCAATPAWAGDYRILSSEGDICSDLAAWANGRPSQVRAVDWKALDKAVTPGVAAVLTHPKAQESGADDTFFMDAFGEGQGVVFMKSANSESDYRDNILYVISANGQRTCFVNGAINGNRYCQDELHEQLPNNCAVCDANYQWQPQWRLKSELLVWRDTVYAADIIANGPYLVLWKSPARFRFADESAPRDASALCVLER